MTSLSNGFDSCEYRTMGDNQNIYISVAKLFLFDAHNVNNNTDDAELSNTLHLFQNGNNNNINNNNNNQGQNTNQCNDNANNSISNIFSNNNQENNINQNTGINISNNSNNGNSIGNNNNINNIVINKLQQKHTKNSFDCLRRKLKVLVKKNSINYINSQINDKKDEIKYTEYSDIQKTQKKDEEKYMNSTLGEIFSNRISNKYTTIKDKDNYNKKKINELCRRNERLKKIFNVKFIECLNHFIGKETKEELEGMKTFEELVFNDEMNKKNLKLIAFNYVQRVDNIRERTPKKKKKDK